ncbi:septum formation initiator family protein [Streptomyces sp. NPDC101150]|uniref:septum formation initiator family protein n=1 Tax=Streptomyces sp. NPDC101150 TaxID=3366114 RepID=UPI00382E12E6
MKGRGRPRGGAGRLAALLPAASGTAARTPFVLLIVLLLGSGLIALLLLNSALNQGSFELSKLEKKTGDLTDEQQALQQEVDGYSAPGALEKRARRLGMVPGGNPAFLMPDGTVRGKPSVATGEDDAAALSATAEPPLLGPSVPESSSAPEGPSGGPSLPAASGTAGRPGAPAAPSTPHAPGPRAAAAAPAPTAPGR